MGQSGAENVKGSLDMSVVGTLCAVGRPYRFAGSSRETGLRLLPVGAPFGKGNRRRRREVADSALVDPGWIASGRSRPWKSSRESGRLASGTQGSPQAPSGGSSRHSTRRTCANQPETTPARHKQAGVVSSLSAPAVLGFTIRSREWIDRLACHLAPSVRNHPIG